VIEFLTREFLPRWGWLIGVIGLGLPFLCYVLTAFGYYLPLRRIGMCMQFAGYAFAIVGTYLDMKGI
jgi:hypothetical protein